LTVVDLRGEGREQRENGKRDNETHTLKTAFAFASRAPIAAQNMRPLR